LFYFAATLPTVGFMHGAADLNPLDEAARRDNRAPPRHSFPAPPRLLARRMI
jgi:hypothetical protein